MTPRRPRLAARPYDPCIYEELPGSFMLKIGDKWMDIRRNVWLEWNESSYRWESTGSIFPNTTPVLIPAVEPFVGQTWFDAQHKRWKRWNGRCWMDCADGPKLKA